MLNTSSLNTLIKKAEEAAELFSVLVEQQRYNPSQAIKVIVGFKYCELNEAWDIAERYYSQSFIKGKLRKVDYLS